MLPPLFHSRLDRSCPPRSDGSARWRSAAARGVGLLGVVLLLTGQEPPPAPPSPAEVYHIGFSAQMFTGINLNDAKAALKAWIQTIVRELNIPLAAEPLVLDNFDALSRALRDHQIEAVEMPVTQYALLNQPGRFEHFFVGASGGQFTEEYVVLTRRDSTLTNLAKLRGCHLTSYQHYRACLAEPWLDVRLAEEGCPPAEQFCARITRTSKLTAVVLPVFFGKADACLVTREGFELLNELNPQLAKQLQILAVSVPVVPAVLCFRADAPAAFETPALAALRDLHGSAAGRQLLLIFHRDKLEEKPAAVLQSALDLVAARARLAVLSRPTAALEDGAPPSEKENFRP